MLIVDSELRGAVGGYISVLALAKPDQGRRFEFFARAFLWFGKIAPNQPSPRGRSRPTAVAARKLARGTKPCGVPGAADWAGGFGNVRCPKSLFIGRRSLDGNASSPPRRL